MFISLKPKQEVRSDLSQLNTLRWQRVGQLSRTKHLIIGMLHGLNHRVNVDAWGIVVRDIDTVIAGINNEYALAKRLILFKRRNRS